MAYSLYTSEGVFADPSINVICNKIIDALETQFGSGPLNADFGVTGTVAKIIQGDPLTDVKGVAFACSDETIYNYIKANIGSIIKTTGVIKYSNFMQVITSRVNIEFWYRDSAITLIDTNGIFSEDKTEVPAY